MTFVRNTMAALIATVCGAAAFAATPATAAHWAATHTLAHEVFSQQGDTLAAAEEVAPGQALHVVVTLALRNRDALDARIGQILQGRRDLVLDGGQMQSLHLPTPAQAQAVVDHLHAMGFRDITVAPNRLVITAEGSVANAKSAFNTELHWFGQGESRVYANTRDVQVPAALAGIVTAVHGLQNASGFHTMSHATPASVAGHNPTDFQTIYNAQSLPAATNSVVGIISDGVMDATLTDLASFTTKNGLPAVNATVKYVGTKGTDKSGTTEWDIDSQDSLAAAGGQVKQMIFYTATSLADGPLTQAYNQAVVDHVATVINVSLGECETTAKRSGVMASDDQIFAAGVAQGQTFSVSTGDSGSQECGKRRGNLQSYPAVSPYVMAIGGTTLNTTGTTYVSESTWSGGGGGPSTTEPVPSWQKASGVVGTSKFRGVPDVSFDADPNSGAIIIVSGKNQQWGGTSLAAPIFAGFWARIQSMHGNALVPPNAAIYQYGGANPSLFHDVTTGSNGGFSAAAGWDYATGWGSLDMASFAAFVASHSGF